MQITLSDKRQIADGTLAVWFTPERPFRFTAGQFGSFTLDLPQTDAKGATRTFSFAGSPNNDSLMIATRMTGSVFKRALAAAPVGTPLQLMGPTGLFTLHREAARPAVFFAGGIGITPVRSIAEYATQEGLPHRIDVFYSNRTRAQTAFLEDLKGWEQSNGNLRLIPTLTDEASPDPGYEHGPVNEAMMRKYLSDMLSPVYYVVGPPGMVAAMKELLARLGVDATQVKAEDFIGY